MEESMKDYEKELEASFRTIKEGDVVKGTVIDVNEEEVTLDLKYYAQGIIKAEDMSADPSFSLLQDVKEGEELEAVVVSMDDGQGNILLSRKEANETLGWDVLQNDLEDLCPIRQKILVVDDSPLNTKIMESALIEDYDVLISHSGKEALSICNSNDPPDLILLDIIMPEIDGFDVLQWMEQEKWLDDIPVILISSEDSANIINKGFVMGASDYIKRPFDYRIVYRYKSGFL